MLDLLRLSQLLSPTMPVPSPVVQPDVNQIQNPDASTANDDSMISQLQQMMNPQSTAETELRNMLANMPQRQDYAPSKGRQIGAFMAGLGTGSPVGISGGQPIGYQSNLPVGLKVQEHILDDPYNKAVDDFGLKLKPLSELASAERASNTNQRLTAGVLLNQELGRKKLKETERANQEKERIADEKLAIAHQRAQVYQFKANNPGLKSVTDEDGMLILYNPITGELHKTGLDTGKMSDADKLDLQVEGKLKEIKARADEARKLETQKQTGRESLQDTKHADDLERDKLKPARTGTSANPKAMTPGQIKQDKINRANDIIDAHPELKRYFIFDKDKGASIKPLGGRFSGDVEADRMKAFNLLHPAAPVDTGKTDHKVGDTKTFPNGNKGRWNGTNWVLVK